MPDQAALLDSLLAEVAALKAASAVAADLRDIKTQLADLTVKVDRALATAGTMPDVAAWTVKDWCQATRMGTTRAYELMNDGTIASIKDGRRRLITTAPQDYLASLAGSDNAT